MTYPCIVYSRDFAETDFAGNRPYKHCKRYQVTIIDRDPDSEIPDKIAELPMCIFDRFYTADNLNHDVYKLFFDKEIKQWPSLFGIRQANAFMRLA
jgi:hypothetical protein